MSKIFAFVLLLLAAANAASWTNWGGNRFNTHHQDNEDIIQPCNVQYLQPLWSYTVGSDVSAIPTVTEGRVFFPDWAGNIWSLNADTGALIWRRRFEEFTLINGTYDAANYYSGSKSRNSPIIKDGKIYLGDMESGWYICLNMYTGDLIWKTLLDSHPGTQMTMSGTAFKNRIYVGTSSKEELLAAIIPGYPCCSFRGKFVSLDANNGNIVWEKYTTPVNFSGNAIWGSSPAIDDQMNAVFFATGNNYEVPLSVTNCISAGGLNCNPADNFVDAVVALDLSDGHKIWSKSFAGATAVDVWTVACIFNPFNSPNCPPNPGQDIDFGQSPFLFTNKEGKKKKAVLGIGQKNGFFHILDRLTGNVLHTTVGGPYGTSGGLQWGSAYDKRRIYVASANTNSLNHTLIGGQVVQTGSWGALDPDTGAILWQTPVPAHTGAIAPQQAYAYSPVTISNDVLFGGSSTINGPNLFALNARTGEILWSFSPGGAGVGGATVVNGRVYWGSGYARGAPQQGNNVFYAFEIPANRRYCSNEHEDDCDYDN